MPTLCYTNNFSQGVTEVGCAIGFLGRGFGVRVRRFGWFVGCMHAYYKLTRDFPYDVILITMCWRCFSARLLMHKTLSQLNLAVTVELCMLAAAVIDIRNHDQ